MKNFAQFTFLFLISIFLSGCKIETLYSSSLRGNCVVTQPDHIVRLGNGDTSFTLAFVGKEKLVSVDSIHGSYKYKSKPVQPLELSQLSQSNAVFVPRPDLYVIKSPQNVVQYVRMNYGRYKLNFDYVLNGQTNSCNFDVDYVLKTKRRYLFFWEWISANLKP
jgi:hypothetical protein